MIQYYIIRGFDLPKASNDNITKELSYTADELFVLRRMIRGEYVTYENSGLSVQNWRELMNRLGRPAHLVQSAS